MGKSINVVPDGVDVYVLCSKCLKLHVLSRDRGMNNTG